MISLQDRYRGAMVGVLAGDALGAPYETWTRARIAEDIEKRGGLVLFDYRDPWHPIDGPMFPAGRPTDDSELTAALAESLINGDDYAQMYQRFRRCVIDEQSLLCHLPAYGFGGTTRRALTAPTLPEAHADWRNYIDPKTGESLPSNGALMRTIPVALRFPRNRVDVMGEARRHGELTHKHPDATAPAVYWSEFVALVLLGKSLPVAFEMMRNFSYTRNEKLKQIVEAGTPIEPKEATKFGGSAVYTLKVALWASLTSNSFAEGIEKAIRNGSDTDTYAAVVGGLLGAHYGIDAIPKHWQDGLHGRERMIELADQLYTVSRPTH